MEGGKLEPDISVLAANSKYSWIYSSISLQECYRELWHSNNTSNDNRQTDTYAADNNADQVNGKDAKTAAANKGTAEKI